MRVVRLMPTHEEEEAFLRDIDDLTDTQYQRFRRIVRRLAQDLDRGGDIRASLRVKPMAGHPGVWELTWEGEDGRATFSFGPEKIPGKRHVIWRRIGGHEIFQEP
jgi:hypothetical protein